MSQFVDNLQTSIRTTTSSLLLAMAKLISGLLLGLTLSLIMQEIFHYEMILFFFVILVTILTFLKVSKSWSWMNLLTFDLICVLGSLLLRMYILLAPGA